MPPFQFDVFGAPPADISPGIAAYAQGMGNAAQFIAQQGQMYGALRSVAQDFMRYKQQQNLQEREHEAQAAQTRLRLAHDRQLANESMGFNREVEARRASQADRELGLRERGVDLDSERLDIMREGQQSENRWRMDQRAEQTRQQMEAERKQLGQLALMQAAAQKLSGPQPAGAQPLMRDVDVPGPLGLQTQQLDLQALLGLASGINQAGAPTMGPGGMGPPTAGGPMVDMAALSSLAEQLQGGQPTVPQLLNAQAPAWYAGQGQSTADAKAAAEAEELAGYQRDAQTDYPLTWDTLEPFHALLGPGFEKALGSAYGGEGGYTVRLDEAGKPVIGGGGEIERRALQNKLDELYPREDLRLNWDSLAGGIATRGQVSKEKARGIGGKLRSRGSSDPDRSQPPQARQLDDAHAAPRGVHPDGTPSGEQSGQAMIGAPQHWRDTKIGEMIDQQRAARSQGPGAAQQPAAAPKRSPLEESALRYFGVGGAQQPAPRGQPAQAQPAASARSEGQSQARRDVRQAERRAAAAERSGDSRAHADALRELSRAKKRLEELLTAGAGR